MFVSVPFASHFSSLFLLGNLSLLEFVKSVDTVSVLNLYWNSKQHNSLGSHETLSVTCLPTKVYKEAKLLRASVINSEKIDRAFEKAINVVFYTLITFIVLAIFGLNPLTLIVSLTSIIVGFAFMVGPASSKMFEGWLFILIRRPVRWIRRLRRVCRGFGTLCLTIVHAAVQHRRPYPY
jgi:small-conductance mechanosensitive channel